jgi:periplasmic divalent cation tolerance protein
MSLFEEAAMTAEAVRVVLSTHPDRAKAVDLGRTLVQERLAACVNVVPGVTSVYRWEGKLCEDVEALLVIKTSSAQADALMARMRALHPYVNPELVVLPVGGGSEAYLKWVLDETG